MDDTRIIDLYWQRSERAIAETDAKYGAYCRMVALNITGDTRDGEECVSDTWLAAWNSMPQARPAHLSAYLAAICRNRALNLARRRGRAKRGGGEAERRRDTHAQRLLRLTGGAGRRRVVRLPHRVRDKGDRGGNLSRGCGRHLMAGRRRGASGGIRKLRRVGKAHGGKARRDSQGIRP